MVRLSRSTIMAIIETSRALIDCGQWRFVSRDALHTLDVCETNAVDVDLPWWSLVLSAQVLRLAGHAQRALDSGDLEITGFDVSALLTPEAYDNTFGDHAPAMAVAA